MLAQRRVLSLIDLFAAQGLALACSTAIVAYATAQTHLYFSAGLTFVLKVVLLPWLLHRLIRRLDVKWDVEGLINVPTTMIIGLVLVVFSFNLAVPISQLASTVTRSTLGIAMATVMLSFLMMITRRKAMPQVIGFLSMENGLFFAATSATYGMPMVVELGIALDVLVGHADPGRVLLPDPRAVRQPRPEAPREAEGERVAAAPPVIEILLVLGLPLAGAALLALVGHRRVRPGRERRRSSLADPPRRGRADRARGDATVPCSSSTGSSSSIPFNVFLVALTAFVGFTTAIFSRPYMRIEEEHRRRHAPRGCASTTACTSSSTSRCCWRFSPTTWASCGWRWRRRRSTTVLLVSLYRTPASLEAAWKYFILCGVGIAQALFGTILLYFAAEKVLGAGGGALLWTELDRVKGQLEPTVLSLAFVFLLVGYGTKVGLVPLHNWLPDAHAEGPTPVSAVLSGLLLNVALYAVVRCKVLVEGAVQTSFAKDLMMGFGLLSVVVAAFLLSRQKDIKRLFAYSSIEHMGIITFAFGMGGPIANFAGLLHMTVHSLTKSAIFFTVGHATQKTGTQVMDDIRGLVSISPLVGWGLALGTLAILGMPPFGVFASEFLILTTAMREQPWATPFLLGALGLAFAAVFSKVQPMVFGETDRASDCRCVRRWCPVFAHLALVLMLGLWIPPFLADWYRAGGAAHRMNADRAMNLSPLGLTAATRRLGAAGAPCVRQLGSASGRMPRGVGTGRASGARCGCPTSATASAAFACASLLQDADGLTLLEHTMPDADVALSRPCAASFPPRTACSAPRSTSSAYRPTPTTSGLGCGWRAGRSTSSRFAAISWRRTNGSRARRNTRSSRWRATASTRSRSGPFTPASSSPGTSGSRSSARRCCASKSGWATCTRASRSDSRRMPIAEGCAPRRTRVGRQHRRLRLGVRAGARGHRRHAGAAARAVAARAPARARAHRESPGRPGLPRQRRRLRVRTRPVLAPQGGRAADQSRGIRPSTADGRRRARRGPARPVAPSDADRMRDRGRDARARGSHRTRHLRRARRRAGSLPQLRTSSRRSLRAHSA